MRSASGGNEPLAVDDQPRVGIAGDVFRLVVEADPGRGHGVGVDVVEQILDAKVLHLQVELAAELPADELGVFGQKKNALAGRKRHDFGWFHRCLSTMACGADSRSIATGIPPGLYAQRHRGQRERRKANEAISLLRFLCVSGLCDHRLPGAHESHRRDSFFIPFRARMMRWMGQPTRSKCFAELVVEVAFVGKVHRLVDVGEQGEGRRARI